MDTQTSKSLRQGVKPPMQQLIGRSSSSDQSRISARPGLEPPAYDTLSIAPPAADHQAAGEVQFTADVEADVEADRAHEKKSLKEKWRTLKEEEELRKSERIQHVTPAEADQITGLARRRDQEAKQPEKKGKGLLALMLLGAS